MADQSSAANIMTWIAGLLEEVPVFTRPTSGVTALGACVVLVGRPVALSWQEGCACGSRLQGMHTAWHGMLGTEEPWPEVGPQVSWTTSAAGRASDRAELRN